jgi:D-beta-D-heptose 7-phosphate kinase/D-beta-D-heptose 1-phosphate adenosyltransferase
VNEVLDRFRGTRVLVVGDVMLDEYVWGAVSRISPEAPVPVVDVHERTFRPGGAANTAAGVAALGGIPVLAGIVGDDAHGSLLRGALEEQALATDGIVADSQRLTTTKTRVIAHNQQVVRTDVEQRVPLAEPIHRELLEFVLAHVHEVDSVVISDYAKGVVTDELAQTVIAEVNQAGKPVVVDPKGLDYAKYAHATLLTPNVHEAARAAGVYFDGAPDVAEICRRLTPILAECALLLTRGQDGMTLVSNGASTDIPTAAQEVYDVTGAGDTVVAVVAIALACGAALEDAVRLANVAAGLSVAHVGAAQITLDELRAACGNGRSPRAGS